MKNKIIGDRLSNFRHICLNFKRGHIVKDEHKLLRSGLTSEIFLLAFIKPDRAYQLAKRLKNIQTMPDVSKIYPAREKLEDQGYLERKHGLNYPNYEKLAEAINSILKEKDEQLDESELKLLTIFLRNTKYFEDFSDDIIKQIHAQEKGLHKMDALKVISSRVGALVAVAVIMKTTNPKWKENFNKLSFDAVSSEDLVEKIKDFETLWNELMAKVELELPKKLTEFDFPNKEIIFKRIFNVFQSIPGFSIVASDNLINKLAKLSEGKDIFSDFENIYKFSINFK